MPALGFRTFEIVRGENEPLKILQEQSNGNSTDHTTTFTNNEFEIKVDPDNAIVTLSKSGKEYFRGNELIFLLERQGVPTNNDISDSSDRPCKVEMASLMCSNFVFL